jgi:putative transposase
MRARKNTSLRYRVMALNIKRRHSMKDSKKLVHAVWQCKYHIVWCPKYRFRILKGEVRESVVVGFLKGKSAIKMFKMHDELKKKYWGRHFWAKGYCVSTIGLDEGQVRKYVRWQLKKDKTMDHLKLWKKK